MRALRSFAAAACLVATTPAWAAPTHDAGESQRLRALLDAEWDYQMRDQPTLATAEGDARFDDRLPDDSPESFARRKQHAHELVARTLQIARARLDAADQLTYDLFLRNARLDDEGARFPGELMPLTQMGGPYDLLSQLADFAPHRTVADYEHFLARIAAFPRWLDQQIALMKQGVAHGITPPRVTLAHVDELIGNQLADDATQTPLYRAEFAELPTSLAPAERTRLQTAAKQAIAEQYLPALRRFRSFFTSEYLPHTRTSIALSALPDGAAWYAYNVRIQTTTELSPERIHQIGLDEVARIHGEIDQAMRAAGWTGNLAGFVARLRSDPKQFYSDRESLLAGYRVIAKRIDPELMRLFGKLPRTPYGVRAVAADGERTQPTAHYLPGSVDAGRPGWFYANTYDLKSRPKWEMETLTLHEAVPGHHLQMALADELGELPRFRRASAYTAFVEGWGVYAETLGGELGLLQDADSRFGALTFQMWRAVRLVVDTGMHAKGWTRAQAIQYFVENSGRPLHDVEVEVDRYIVWPGQSLAYKIGQLKLRELRALAQERLGTRFDVRAFHDFVLGSGALPLDVLETRVKAWIETQAAGKR